MSEFQGFPKIPRLNREIVITEKIDGTNAQVHITRYTAKQWATQDPTYTHHALAVVDHPTCGIHVVRAGSRNRWLTLGKGDNFGFAGWVNDNAMSLVDLLGDGQHFGEWWGAGIQRTYEMMVKRFSLFNTARWGWLNDDEARRARGAPVALRSVPELYRGPWRHAEFGYDTTTETLNDLRRLGSKAAPGFMDPEGIVVFHTASNTLYKATCKDDEHAKSDSRISAKVDAKFNKSPKDQRE